VGNQNHLKMKRTILQRTGQEETSFLSTKKTTFMISQFYQSLHYNLRNH
jgi:hypothetical protein